MIEERDSVRREGSAGDRRGWLPWLPHYVAHTANGDP
jgi:hypothetical protein